MFMGSPYPWKMALRGKVVVVGKGSGKFLRFQGNWSSRAVREIVPCHPVPVFTGSPPVRQIRPIHFLKPGGEGPFPLFPEMTEPLFPCRPGRENAWPGEMMEIWPVLAPHTPDLPGSWKGGGGRPLIGAYSRLRSEFDRWGADFEAVVAYTPGWQTRNITLLDASPEHRSSRDFSGFGHDYRYDPPGAPGLAACLLQSAKASGMPISTGFHGVDHAISIPLFFLVPDGETPVLPVSQSLSGVRQASLFGETLGKIDCPGHGSGRILLLMSGIWSQNPREMAKREKDPLIDRWIARILSKLSTGSLPDWSFLPELTREVLDRLDAPGRLRELHLLKGIGARNARVWETERDLGIFQALISFDPVRPETRESEGFPRQGGSFRSDNS